MVILPTEKRFDWKYPPVMLFSIVFINILVFFLYQSGDSMKLEQAHSLYVTSGLLEKEWDAYRYYLSTEVKDNETLEAAEELHDSEDYYTLSMTILIDRNFYPWLEHHSEQLSFDGYDLNDTWEYWRELRSKVNELVDSISIFQFGLTPGDVSPITLISHQFLHGDFMHLLGNLFFLLLSGFAVEAAIGSRLFLALYLASGVAGGLLYALLDRSGGAPLVGASGAISGVMAMYLGIFKLRKIEFFYWIFVFAGYFRAPALLILPIYVGKELFEYMTNTDSNVAFMAHAGGFVSGAIMTLAVHYLKPQLIDRQYVEEDQSIDPQREARAQLYQLVEETKFQTALKQLDSIEQRYGTDFELQLLRFNLQRILGRKDRAQGFQTLVSARPGSEQELHRVAEAWAANPSLQGGIPAIDQIKLAIQLANPDNLSLAENILQSNYDASQPNSDIGILARKLGHLFSERREKKKADHYNSIADHCLAGIR